MLYSEYDEAKHLFVNTYPWLFPGGIGDLYDLEYGDRGPTNRQWARHLLNRTKGITNQTIFFQNLESIPTLALVRIVRYILRRVNVPTSHGRPSAFLTMMMHIRVGRTMATIKLWPWWPWFCRHRCASLWSKTKRLLLVGFPSTDRPNVSST